MLPAVICSQELRSAPLCQSLSTHGYAVVRLSAEETATVDRMTEQLRRFMALPQAEKEQQGGNRSLAGVTVGWEMLDFPNDHVPRLPEERDVFSVPLCAVSQAPWPSEPFRIATREVLRMYANLSNALLQRLASELGCGLADLLSADSPCFELLNPDHDPTMPSPLSPSSSSSSSASSVGPADRFSELKNNNGLRRELQHGEADRCDSNLTLFCYHDPQSLLPEPQRCMIHQDVGVLTLLARPEVPGLEVLSADGSGFLQLEALLHPGDVVMFAGQTLQRITRGLIPAAVHRVVRTPGATRYSMPFELKASGRTLLAPLDGCPAVACRSVGSPHQPHPQQMLFPNICDSCGTWVGLRLHRCDSCEDFDLCSRCHGEYASGSGSVLLLHPHPEHRFEQVPAPKWRGPNHGQAITAGEFYWEISRMRQLHRAWRFQQIDFGLPK